MSSNLIIFRCAENGHAFTTLITNDFTKLCLLFFKEDTTMTITDVKIRKIIPEGRLRGIVSITIDEQLAIHDIKVVQGDERLFVAMPSRKDENGAFRDIIHPISPEARAFFEEQILDAFTRHIDMLKAEAEAEQAGL